MAKKTINLNTLLKVRRWAGRSLGQDPNLSETLQWLEEHPEGIPLKSSVAHVIVRDVSRSGTPDDLRKLHALGYELSAKCTHQVDGNALHSAVQHGKKANALALMDLGLDPRQRLYPTGPSAMDEALINGHLKLFGTLDTLSPAEVTTQEREAFLMAAISTKTRQESWARDEPKNRTLQYVLQHFGPFEQDPLDKALVTAAGHGWEQCFATLVGAGAQPDRPLVLMHSRFHAHGNPLLQLLSKVAIARWVPILNQYGNHDDWLFPPTPVSETNVPVADVVWLHGKISAYRQSILDPDIQHAIGSIQSRRRQNALETTLEEPETPRSARPRI